MLVLSRKLGEKITIGDDIVITVVDIDRGKIRIGLEAPRDMPIYRNELMGDKKASRDSFGPERIPPPLATAEANAAKGVGWYERFRPRAGRLYTAAEAITAITIGHDRDQVLLCLARPADAAVVRGAIGA